MTLTFQQIKDSPTKQKFYSESLDKIITRSEILKIVSYDWNRVSDEDEFNQFMLNSKYQMRETDYLGRARKLTDKEKKRIIPFDLEILESKQFRRWDKFERRMRLHNSECELSESPSCSCWCLDMYHGLRYQRLPNEIIISPITVETKSENQ